MELMKHHYDLAMADYESAKTEEQKSEALRILGRIVVLTEEWYGEGAGERLAKI